MLRSTVRSTLGRYLIHRNLRYRSLPMPHGYGVLVQVHPQSEAAHSPTSSDWNLIDFVIVNNCTHAVTTTTSQTRSHLGIRGLQQPARTRARVSDIQVQMRLEKLLFGLTFPSPQPENWRRIWQGPQGSQRKHRQGET